MNKEYLTLSQAIRKYNGISLSYLTRMVKSGEIEGDRQGYQWIVKEESLKAWLAAHGKLQPSGESAGNG